jgi:hypothetical protein
MPGVMGERFPFEPLVPIIERRFREPNGEDNIHYCSLGINAKAAQVTGVKRGRINGWRRAGLTLAAADEIAWELGLHPAEIWPIEWGASAGVEPPLPLRASRSAA